jgi:hypothetical protein
MYWIDKWHISPYYATAHALCVLRMLRAIPPIPRLRQIAPAVERALEWLRQTQNVDGSWGFYGQPTAEETAYGLLALAAGGQARTVNVTEADRRRCALAARYLRETAGRAFPPMWVDKCLYTPTLVVQKAIEAALVAHDRLRSGPSNAAATIHPTPGFTSDT